MAKKKEIQKAVKDYTSLKNSIIELLKEKKLFENTDLTLLDELEYQMLLMDEAKEDIKTRGIQINVRADGDPFYQLNQSVSVVHKCTRNVQSIYRQLAIAPQDRAKLKMNTDEDPLSDFNKLMAG